MQPICEAFVALVEYADSLSVGPMNKLPGCWERDVDGVWHVCLNGHNKVKQTRDGTDVLPFTCLVTFNGFPAGVLNPFGGLIAAGEAANEETFIAALRAATVSANT